MTSLDALGVRVLDPSPAPGSPEWRRIMTASKVAAVVGLSPWESRFSLWHAMAGLIEDEPQSDVMLRGEILEPAIREWVRLTNPDWDIAEPNGMWTRDGLEWAGATPDGIITTPEGPALLECKTDARFDSDWGTPGTDDIPVYYRCQVMWQMHVTGIHRTHIAVLSAGLEFKAYIVDYDAEDAALLEANALAFMATLPGQPGEQRPDLDGDTATLTTVSKLHPDIDRDEKVEIGPDLNAELLRAKAALKAAEDADRYAKTRVLDLMGVARIGTARGVDVVRRQPTRGAIALHAIKTKTTPATAKEAA